MYKYMCRNPPDDKYMSSENRTELSSSSPPEKSLLARSVVNLSEKVKKDRRFSFTDQNEYEFDGSSNEDESFSSDNVNCSENQTLNCSFNDFTPLFPEDIHNFPLFPSQNSSWKISTNKINPSQGTMNEKFNICSNKESKLTKDNFVVDIFPELEDPKSVPSPKIKLSQNQMEKEYICSNEESELTKDTFEVACCPKLDDPKPVFLPEIKLKQNQMDREYISRNKETELTKDTFGVDFSPKLEDPKSVPPPKIKLKQNKMEREYLKKQKEVQLLKSSTPCNLQELFSSTMSENSASVVNENLDKPVELKAELCTKSEDQHKVSKPLPVVTTKPKQTSKVVERVIKEQDNLFGIFLSTIDEQIMSKKDQRRNEKKDAKSSKDVNKDNKSYKNKKDNEIKHKKDETIVNENDIYKEKKNLESNHDLKQRIKHSKYNTKHKEYDKDDKHKEHESKSKDETKITESKDKEVKSKNKESITKGKELKQQKNKSKNKDDKKNKARKSEEYDSVINDIISKLKESKNKGIQSTSNNPKNKVEKSANIKTIDTFRRCSTKKEKPKIDKTVIDKTVILPTQTSKIDDKKLEQFPIKNNINSQNDLFRPNRDQCRPNQNQFRRKEDEILIVPDQFCSNKDNFTPNQDHFQYKDHFSSNPDQFKQHSAEFRANLKFLHQDVPIRNKFDYHQNEPQGQNSIDFYHNEDKNRKDSFACQRTSMDRGSYYFNKIPVTSDEKSKREYPQEERKKSPGLFSNKDKYKDGRRSRLEDRFYRREQKFPIKKKNYLRRPRFEEKRTPRNENYGNHRKWRSREKKYENPNIEPKEETKMGQEESKQEVVKNEVKAVPSTLKEIAEMPKTETEEKINMFNTFMKHIFGSCDSSFLLEYLDKCGKPNLQSKKKRVRRIINSDSESEEEVAKEKVKIDETQQIKEIEQQVSDKLREDKNVIVNETIRKTRIYSSEKPLVTNEESSIEENVIIKKSVRKVFKKRNPLELLLNDVKTVNKGSFAETGDQTKQQEVYDILDNSKNEEKDAKQEETLEKEESKEEISSENKFRRRRLRSVSRSFIGKINYTDNSSNKNTVEGKEKEIKEETISVISESKLPRKRHKSLSRSFIEKDIFSTDKSSNEENSADGKEKKKKEETIPVINEITPEKSKFVQRRSRSSSRRFVEKVNISVNKSLNEENSTDAKEEKKEETISVINEMKLEKNNRPRRRLKSLSRNFSEKRNIATDKFSNEESFGDGKEKKEETISVTNEITLEKNKLPQRRSRSLSCFVEKINIFTLKTSNEENSTREKEKEIKKETISVINESKLLRRRRRSSSRCYVKSSEEYNTADEKQEERKEETMSVESKISAEVNPEKKKRGRKPRKIAESSVSSTVESETTKTETELKKKKRKMRRNNWANGIIKGTHKRKKVDRMKLSLSVNPEISKLSSTENFNENIENETELPQILQSQILDDEEYALFKIDSTQDIYYFLDDRNSFDCKLCDYKGKSIVSHYRTKHPESENLISRLKPEEAEKAQIESKLNKFDEIEPFEEIENGKKRKTTFVCRFCNMLMTTEISTFVDHVCCHTGEYRYSCELCPFITGYKQKFFIHCYKTHPELETPLTFTHIWPSPPNFRIMFGYLCKACNFTQILRKNIQTHINVSHLGQNIEIIKISMSSKSVTLDDLITTKNIETKTNEIEKNKEKIPEPIKEKDIFSKEQLIEDKKLKEIEEIFNNITLKQSALQPINQLENKCQSIMCEDEPVNIENHQIEDLHSEENTSPIKDTTRITSTCSLMELDSSENENGDSQKSFEDETIELSDEEGNMHRNDKEMNLSNVQHTISTYSNQKGVHDRVQELSANLSEIKDQEEKLENTEKIINVGAIEVKIRNKNHNYICKVPNCNFTSPHKTKFIQHCNNVHSNITVLCEICALENPYNYFTMISLLCHLLYAHNTKSTKPEIVISIPSQTPEIDSIQEISEPQPIIENLNPKHSQPNMGFLQIKDIRTLTEEEEQELQLSMQNNSSKIVQNSKIIHPNLVNVDKKLPDLPANSESKCVSSTENVIGYKTKKIFNEMLVYPKILDIFKCPIKICSFSSGSQKEFQIHMRSHKCQIKMCVYCQKDIPTEDLIKHIKSVHSHCTLQCAFCFYRTVSKKYLVYHQKNVHKQSCDTLVEGLYYQLCPSNITQFVFDIPPRNMIIFPYMCAQDNCTQQFLIADDFMIHLRIYHERNFICAVCNDPTAPIYYVTAQDLIQHYVMHNIALYQCQYCIFGTNDVDTLFMHYAKNHQHLEPICYVRQKKNKNISSKTLDDLILMNMDSKQFVEPEMNTDQSKTKQNISISSPTITSTIPEDHNYNRTFVEKSPTSNDATGEKNLEKSKIINVESNNAAENAVVPLSIDNFEKSNDLTKKVTDLIESEIYKCGAPNCTYRTKFFRDFRMHLLVCNALSNSYFCAHCDKKFTSVINLRNHIEIHGKNRFTCGICEYKSSLEQVVKHMKDFHNIKTTKFNPVSLKNDMDKDHFVVEAVKETRGEQKYVFKNKLLKNASFSKGKNKVGNVLGPKVIDSDFTLTLNPNPGLNENDKMTDEKTNLATSSHHDQMGCETKEKADKENKDDKIYPEFIPHSKRFTCSALNCNYLTHENHDNKPTLPVGILDQIASNDEIQNHIDEQGHCEPDVETIYYKINEEQIVAPSSSQDNTKEITSPLPQQTSEIIPLKVKHTNEEESSDSESDTSSKDMSNLPLNCHCKYCDFVAKSTKTLRKHERSHYMNYKYNNCNCCEYALQVKSHNKTKMSITEISELSLKRKRPLFEENLAEKPAKNKQKIITDKATTITSSIPDMIDDSNIQIYYGCYLCPKKSNKLDEIRSHFFENHKLKTAGPFKYKKVILDKSKTQHYKCNYCEWFADAKSLKQHCAEMHGEIWVAWRNTKLKCTICSQIFPSLQFIKRHFNKEHSTENLSFHSLLEDGIVLDKTEFLEEKQILFCIYCRDQFDNRIELFNHHSLFHSHLQFQESLDEEKQELKNFKCPNCSHYSNHFYSMRKHLMNHYNIKPLVCSHCNEFFMKPYNLKQHHFLKHGDLPLIINKVPEFNKQIEKITPTILHLNKDGTYSTKMKPSNKPFLCSHCNTSFKYWHKLKKHYIQKHGDIPVPEFTKQINEDETYSVKNEVKRPHNNSELDEPPSKILILDGELDNNPPLKRAIAKKITSNLPENVEYSFYGTKPCNIIDYRNVMSEIDIMGKVMRINVVAMSHILNLSPKVQLVDIKNRISF